MHTLEKWLRGESGKATLLALAAAAFYACATPLSKRLLESLPPVLLAGLLYLGAGVGAAVLLLFGAKRARPAGSAVFAREEVPYVIVMVLLDVFAPILLLFGLRSASAASASLLNNFEIVATVLIALLFFRESISPRLWVAVALITLGSCLLTFDANVPFRFSGGSVLVLLATVCWGLENNCTRKLSQNNPILIVAVKGLGSGAVALALGLAVGERFSGMGSILLAMLTGFFTYGISIACYIRAQRTLGAAKTSAYYAAAPFIGAALSFALLGERANGLFFIALLFMGAGALLTAFDLARTE